MKVVGLLSGGKDSCFNLCHCVKQGHELVALASLRPPGGKDICFCDGVLWVTITEEIDSYLYQTVGQDGLHFIAEALELPLYRRAIHGTAVDQGGDYASTSAARLTGRVEGDETEDLYALLEQVLAAHPDIQGVSVGAILSNYQRVRVEHVCARLGLQSLSYLWQYDQTQLLEDMAESGMECIIIKVAGAGLGLRHLGQDVCSPVMRSTLSILKERWGTHPAGEGGEYETFTVNCPLFKKRIDLVKTEQVVLSSSDPRYDIGTVAYLRIQEARLVALDTGSSNVLASVPVPQLLDEEACELRQTLESFDAELGSKAADQDVAAVHASEAITHSFRGPWASVAGITSSLSSPDGQMRQCFEILLERLSLLDMSILNVLHINLYLSSMSLFSQVNAVYNTFFGPSPPTRACVACPLPVGCHVKMDVLAYKSSADSDRSALHVRGLSYWAPANIGPYSQAVRVGDSLFVAGQIGLLPASLALPLPRSLAMEAALSSQHLRRIVKAVQEGTGGGFQASMQSCICWLSGPTAAFQSKANAVRAAWRQWRATDSHLGESPPLLIVQVSELPKGAQIEWQAIYSALPFESDVDSETEMSPPIQERSNDSAVFSEQRLVTGRASTAVITTFEESIAGMVDASAPVPRPDAFSVRVFYRYNASADLALAQARELWSDGAAVTAVPVLNIASFNRQDVNLAFIALGSTTNESNEERSMISDAGLQQQD